MSVCVCVCVCPRIILGQCISRISSARSRTHARTYARMHARTHAHCQRQESYAIFRRLCRQHQNSVFAFKTHHRIARWRAHHFNRNIAQLLPQHYPVCTPSVNGVRAHIMNRCSHSCAPVWICCCPLLTMQNDHRLCGCARSK